MSNTMLNAVQFEIAIAPVRLSVTLATTASGEACTVSDARFVLNHSLVPVPQKAVPVIPVMLAETVALLYAATSTFPVGQVEPVSVGGKSPAGMVECLSHHIKHQPNQVSGICHRCT